MSTALVKPDGYEMPPVTREAIVGCARQLIGRPYRHQGRDPAIGIDCVAVAAYAILEAIAQSGHRPPFRLADVPNDNPRRPRDDSFMEAVGGILRPRPVDGVLPGDVVAMQLETRYPFHVAVVGYRDDLGGLTVVHAYESRSGIVNKCTEAPYTRWGRFVRRAFEYPVLVAE